MCIIPSFLKLSNFNTKQALYLRLLEIQFDWKWKIFILKLCNTKTFLGQYSARLFIRLLMQNLILKMNCWTALYPRAPQINLQKEPFCQNSTPIGPCKMADFKLIKQLDKWSRLGKEKKVRIDLYLVQNFFVCFVE